MPKGLYLCQLNQTTVYAKFTTEGHEALWYGIGIRLSDHKLG